MAEAAETAKAGEVPALAAQSVLVVSEEIPETATVQGFDFNSCAANGGKVDYDALLGSYLRSGFQSTNLGLAVEQINKMLAWRLSDEPIGEDDMTDMEERKKVKCTIFLSYTSNLISSGLRETLRFLAQHSLVNVMCTTAGGIEEDFIKCLAPTYLGDFSLDGAALRKKGLNRIGNLLVPNSNYCKFEDWMNPILDAMLAEQKEDGVVWTPSKMIHRFGKELGSDASKEMGIVKEESVYWWTYKNGIPVYCPAITDGSIGDMVYFHSYKNPGLVIDIAGDIRGMNDSALQAKKSGMIILGGGLVKHHVCNANLMRNGADYSVFINTANEFDGSDSGARPDEAISWGKIRFDAKPVKLYAEVTLVFPLIVAQTFAKQHFATIPEDADEAADAE